MSFEETMHQAKNAILLSLVVAFVAGCAPDRFPSSPIEEETRRPNVAIITPQDTIAVVDTTIDIWFDELMQEQTIEPSVTVAISNSPISSWNTVDGIASIAMNPSNPMDMLLVRGSERGGFATDNGGDSWAFNLALRDFTGSRILYDPSDATVLYSWSEDALLRSQDGGATFDTLDSGLPAGVVLTSFNIDPVQSGRFWLGTHGQGVYVSTDAGENWAATGAMNLSATTPITNVETASDDANTVFASSYGYFAYRSTDGGATWEWIRNGLGASVNLSDIVVSPTDNQLVYTSTSNAGVFRSEDGGTNWVNTGGPDDAAIADLIFDPVEPTHLYARSGSHLFMTSDSGNTWTQIALPLEASIGNILLDSQDGSSMVVVQSDTAYRSSDRGESWESIISIDQTSLEVTGTFSISKWSGEKTFLVPDEEGAVDTVIVFPYRYDEALARYDYGYSDTPVVEPNPEAHVATFTPDAPLLDGWRYLVSVQGAFVGGIYQENIAPRDIHGMSINSTVTSSFVVVTEE